jgi:hypothetical protein
VPITELRPEPSASAPASARAALLAVYAAEDALYDGTLPSRAMTYRFDPDELERAFGHLGERLVAMPGLEPEVRAIPTELERVWHRVAIIALR